VLVTIGHELQRCAWWYRSVPSPPGRSIISGGALRVGRNPRENPALMSLAGEVCS